VVADAMIRSAGIWEWIASKYKDTAADHFLCNSQVQQPNSSATPPHETAKMMERSEGSKVDYFVEAARQNPQSARAYFNLGQALGATETIRISDNHELSNKECCEKAPECNCQSTDGSGDQMLTTKERYLAFRFVADGVETPEASSCT
jgi:hypothetical protein